MRKPSIWPQAVLFAEGGFERIGHRMRMLVHLSESRSHAAVLLAMVAASSAGEAPGKRSWSRTAAVTMFR